MPKKQSNFEPKMPEHNSNSKAIKDSIKKAFDQLRDKVNELQEAAKDVPVYSDGEFKKPELETIDMDEMLNMLLEQHPDIDSENDPTDKLAAKQFELWKITSENPMYDVILNFIKKYNGIDHDPLTVEDFYSFACAALDKKKASVTKHIKDMIKHADFANSPFVPLFARVNKLDITPQMFIKQIAIDFA